MKKILILCSVFLTGCFLQSDIKMIQTINLWEEKNCVIELFDWRYVKQLNDTDIIVRTEYNMFWIIEGMGKLKISAREARVDAFREKVQSHADDGYATGARGKLMKEIDKLRSELNLWENNLGFFANSKQADLLKEEFEKKMQAARQQIALLEAKLRVLDENESTENEQ